jgi:hypothetical protein
MVLILRSWQVSLQTLLKHWSRGGTNIGGIGYLNFLLKAHHKTIERHKSKFLQTCIKWQLIPEFQKF